MKAKSWIISVNMGYGHQRTAFSLKDLAPEGKFINANEYPGIPEKDKRIWDGSRKSYEFISKFKRIPLLGNFIFFVFNQFQKILNFYPKRDLSKPNFFLKQTFSLIQKGWGKHLIKELRIKNKELRINLPIISTFFTAAFMAEYFKYPGDIFCIVCDADISRTWVSINPQKSRIKYFAPTARVVERLKFYGVNPKNIFLTGYPLPTESLEILKDNLGYRYLNLDPRGRCYQKYSPLVKKYIGDLPKRANHPLTIMFAVGGAGAQKELGIKIVKSLREKIKKKEIKVILVAGIKKEVKKYFEENLKKMGLQRNKYVEILFEKDINNYFQKFNQTLKTTDILWTKPSELSFFTALGLPIIIAPVIGSQEEFNREWLLELGSGLIQKNPRYTHQWLFDLLNSGWFAEAALQGFIEGKKFGTIKIKEIIKKCRG